jgi:hypothetical protein
MSAGPFFHTDPIGLTLAADQRFGLLDPFVDAVWQLNINPNKALALETSFGLQAQKFGVFPIFLINRRPVWTIGDFFSQPRVDEIYSNYARLTCTPAAGFEARLEVWAQTSTTLLCRISLHNLTKSKAMLGIRAAAELFPLEGTAGMATASLQYQPYLIGRSESLCITLAASGKSIPVYSPFSALQSEKEVASGEEITFTWRCSAAQDEETSIKSAFQPFPENWDAATAHIRLSQQAELMEISTPYADWDAVFLTCQNAAQQALIRTEANPEQLNFCPNRSPDYSYTHSMPAATQNLPLEPNIPALGLAQLCQALLPIHAPEAAAVMLAQLPALGDPPIVPGLGRKVLPFPCLAQCAAQIYTLTGDLNFLAQIYPPLRETCMAWFEPSLDRDQDSLPEWAVLAQTGWDDHPTFNIFNAERLATRIATTESLALGYTLLEEIKALQKLARTMDDQPTIEQADVLQSKLAPRLEALRAQHPEISCWDRDSHQVTNPAVLFEGSISELGQKPILLPQAARINAKLLIELTVPKPTQVKIVGQERDGTPIEETLVSAALSRLGEYLFFTSERVYQRIDHLSIPGLSDQIWLRLYVADLTVKDIGWYLAYLPQEKTEAPEQPEATEGEQSIRRDAPSPSEFSLYPYGLPNYKQKTEETITTGPVNPAWNSLVLRHLLEVGAKAEAAELFASLMRGTIQVLKQEHCIYDGYSSQNAQPFGKSNDIIGLLPLHTFLELAGIRLLAPERVQLTGDFPFPWRLCLRYRGLEVVREGKNTTVTLPDGSVHHHFGSQPRMFFTQPSTESADNQVEDKDQ